MIMMSDIQSARSPPVHESERERRGRPNRRVLPRRLPLVGPETEIYIAILAMPLSSVGEVVRLVQLEQEAVGDVERGEADAHCDGALQPVHAQAFVESANHPLLGHNGAHRAPDGAVRRARHAGRLHAPPHHVQRVGG